jgi:hypothetical protein
MTVEESQYLLPNQVALKCKGKVVWVGPLNAPWDDVECDTIVVSRQDYKAVKLATLPAGCVI